MKSAVAEKREVVIDEHIRSFADAIESKAHFEPAILRLSLLLKRKFGLNHTDLHKIVAQLHSLDTEMTQAFLETRNGRSFSSSTDAKEAADDFRRDYLDQLIAQEIA